MIKSNEITTSGLIKKLGNYSKDSVDDYIALLAEEFKKLEDKCAQAVKNASIYKDKAELFDAHKTELADQIEQVQKAQAQARLEGEREAKNILNEANDTLNKATQKALMIEREAKEKAENLIAAATERANKKEASVHEATQRRIDEANAHVIKCNNEANTVISNANKEASEIINEAKAEANTILTTSEVEAKETLDNAKYEANKITTTATEHASLVTEQANKIATSNQNIINNIRSAFDNTKQLLAAYTETVLNSSANLETQLLDLQKQSEKLFTEALPQDKLYKPVNNNHQKTTTQNKNSQKNKQINKNQNLKDKKPVDQPVNVVKQPEPISVAKIADDAHSFLKKLEDEFKK